MRLERSDLQLEVVVRRIEQGELDLQPDFQRGEVWNLQRKQRLVDTILRQWYVPAVYVLTEEATAREVVLDGQQRLASIRDFFADEIPIDGSAPPHDPEIAALDKLRYSRLPEEMQRRIRRFPLSIVALYAYEPEEPYELFFRLNQHLPLTPPEKRNALYGPAQQQVKSVVSDLVDAGLLNKGVVGFSNGRLAYDDTVARFLLALQLRTLRRPLSNAAIEDFYREDRFEDEVVKDGLAAATDFLHKAAGAQVRLNKATLFSWLVVTYTRDRLGAIPVDEDFVGAFERMRRSLRGKDDAPNAPSWARESLAIYNDRASYRVADTQSVLMRDLIIHLHAQSHTGSGDPYFGGLETLYDAPKSRYALERRLVEYLDHTDWGRLP
jgi:hypothetical protein